MEQGSAGDDSDPQKRKKRFHRHSAHQIQRLEAVFKECPHLDEKQRLQLSRELGLAPRQIKFWFQNRRTQMKGQLERADNSILKAENDKIRCSNIALREALKNIMCPNCGSMRIGDDPYLDEQQLQLENAHLKEELDRVSSIAAKYIGRPVSQFSTTQSSHISLIELSLGSLGGQIIPSPSLGGFGSHGITGSSLELDILSGTSSSVPPTMEIQPGSTINDMDKTLMAEIAANAMNDLVKLLQATEPLWTKSVTDGRDTLNYENYLMLSPRASNHLKKPNARTEASRDSGVVVMNSLLLVDMFMDAGKWLETFSPIVSAAKTIQVLTAGVSGSLSGTLRLMYEELQVLSPLVPTREFVFLRYCQQTEKGSWMIVDVSCDFANGSRHVLPQSRRLPSGCLIEDMSNGSSKVSWVEHVEIQDDSQADHLYGDLIKSGYAFGAERWLATLQRMCERYASRTVSGTNIHDLDGVIRTFDGKANMMKLSQRMVSNFCAAVSTSTNSQQCTTLAGSNESRVRLTVRKTATDPGQPNGLVLCAATSIWLPVSPQNAFNFFRDLSMRPQWDVLSKGGAVQEVAHISCGSHPGNYISILRASDPSQNNMVILQECCIDSWGSLIVYSPIEIPEINMAVSGGDPSCIPLIPSGFMISPDGRSEIAHLSEASSTSSSRHSTMTKSSGSLITIGFQILAGSSPVAKLDMESVTTVNNLIGMTIHQIKAALDCPDS